MRRENIYNVRKNLIIVITLMFLGPSLWADENGTPSKSHNEKVSTAKSNPLPRQSQILDFDADVIEGERTGPSLLVNLDLQAPGLDTLVFQRKNFNDFHVIDMKRKPKYRGRSSP